MSLFRLVVDDFLFCFSYRLSFSSLLIRCEKWCETGRTRERRGEKVYTYLIFFSYVSKTAFRRELELSYYYVHEPLETSTFSSTLLTIRSIGFRLLVPTAKQTL